MFIIDFEEITLPLSSCMLGNPHGCKIQYVHGYAQVLKTFFGKEDAENK